MPQKFISVIIPCYNDGKTIGSIIREVTKSPLVREIIVVDDGSDEETKNIVQNTGSIKLITLKENKGKSSALLCGVDQALSDIIFFVDADLTGFTYQHVDTLIHAFISGDYDMVLGDKDNDVWVFRVFGLSIAFAGDRIVRKQLLIDYRDEIFKAGYLVEPAMNRVFFHRFRVGKVLLHGVGQINKVKKTGFLGLWNDIIMHWNFIQFLGFSGYVSQGWYAKRIKAI